MFALARAYFEAGQWNEASLTLEELLTQGIGDVPVIHRVQGSWDKHTVGGRRRCDSLNFWEKSEGSSASFAH